MLDILPSYASQLSCHQQLTCMPLSKEHQTRPKRPLLNWCSCRYIQCKAWHLCRKILWMAYFICFGDLCTMLEARTIENLIVHNDIGPCLRIDNTIEPVSLMITKHHSLGSNPARTVFNVFWWQAESTSKCCNSWVTQALGLSSETSDLCCWQIVFPICWQDIAWKVNSHHTVMIIARPSDANQILLPHQDSDDLWGWWVCLHQQQNTSAFRQQGQRASSTYS